MQSESCDFLVVGSGAGGLSAAVTAAVAGLKVIVVEKEELFGGASARAGGGIWVPNNSVAKKKGVADSPERIYTYFRNQTGERYDEECVTAFINHGPEMLEFMERYTPVRFRFLPGAADYHCDAPGGVKQGRSLGFENWDAAPLGDELKRLRPPNNYATFLGMQIGLHETPYYMTAGRSLKSMLYVARCLVLRFRDLFRGPGGRSLRLGAGNALIGPLASALFERGGEIRTSTPVRRLVKNGNRVTGAIVDTPQGLMQINASRGVMLATGGFPHDSLIRAELYPKGSRSPEVWGMLPYGNAGDGIRLAQSVGGFFNKDLKSAVALTPITRLYNGEGVLQTFPVFYKRGAPSVIHVLRSGKRFVNEAVSYHDWGVALLEAVKDEDEDVEPVAWIVADHRALRRFGLGPVLPFPLGYKKFIKSGYLKTGRTIRELAENAGIDPDGLEETVAEFNRYAVNGEDPVFKRGSNAYQIAQGDPEQKPNPNVGPLVRPPFYAIRVFAGVVGTFAGINTNANSQVLNEVGEVIEGLYASGNDMSSITGGDYIGGGCTIGPALTFGYIAARHAAGLSNSNSEMKTGESNIEEKASV